MKYVELDRGFYPINIDEETDTSIRHAWGKQFGGWLDWDDLLTKYRVILLAEAECGKTEEFRNAAKKLLNKGKAAFFIPIEELADLGFEASLDTSATKAFEHWKTGFEDAYFFLDSLDEARLNRKRFDSALRRLAKAISHSLDRSHIFVSCRVTDWKGTEDLVAFQRLLPVPNMKPEDIVHDADDALLGPIFSNSRQSSQDNEQIEQSNLEPTIVQLAPLDIEQQRILTENTGIIDASAFQKAIWQNGLDIFSERPGDLIDLAEYWKEFLRFGSLSEMTQYAVQRKLSAFDPYRADNNLLTIDDARGGAERLAAAMTLGKTFTLRSPGQEPDPALSSGALDPRSILPDWHDAKRNALLRRAMFSPATYGRIRFHHRSTQEYLTSNWFNNQLKKGGARPRIFDILFSEVNAVKTIPPSLRAVAAWLALSHDDIREEILNRDPLVLIQHGDPGSLPIETRQQLLRAYAEKHESGDISNDELDHRALWMFSDPELAAVIHEIWDRCTRYDIRGDLLRLIREGQIDACTDLAMDVAQDESESHSHRVIAVQALTACKEDLSLKAISDSLMKSAKSTDSRLAAYFACELFPDHIGIDQLITLIVDTKPPEKNSTGGFGFELEHIWNNCPTQLKPIFVTKISDLSLSKPFIDSHRRISSRYRFLAKHFEPIAHQLVSDLGAQSPPMALVRLLMAIERLDHSYSSPTKKPTLRELVGSHPELQRALFWEDVQEVRESRSREKAPVRYWQIGFINTQLWNLTSKDLPWLYDDIQNRPVIGDKQIALSAIVSILRSESSVEAGLEDIRKTIERFPILGEDLEGYLKPSEEDESENQYLLQQEVIRKKRSEQLDINKASWRTFRNDIVKNPSKLLDPVNGFGYLDNLNRWLRKRVKKEPDKAAKEWRLIEEAFDRKVAQAYRDGMKALWRVTAPVRPRRNKSNQVTTKWSTIYSYAAIGIESEEDSQWIKRLTSRETELAAKHGCFSEQGYPVWLDSLLEANPSTVVPVIEKEFRVEWKSKNDGQNHLLYHYSNSAFALSPIIALRLYEIIVRRNPSSINKLDHGLTILQRIPLSKVLQQRLRRMALKGFKTHKDKCESSLAIRYLGFLFVSNAQDAYDTMKLWIDSSDPETRTNLVLEIFGVLFNRSERGLITETLRYARAETLKSLIQLADLYIRSGRFGLNHRGSDFNRFLSNAEEGRNTVLSTLLNISGPDAYYALIELSESAETDSQSHRFRRLARGIVERDAESPPWTAEDVVAFEVDNVSPIKDGHDLFKVIRSVLDNIRHQFEIGDASSKKLLANLAAITCDDEESVQNWLAEQMSLRASGQYHVHREAEVAKKNAPDIIISATSGTFEIAIEVKQADSWSPKELQHALTNQLAEDYLKVQTRRHGVLFLTDHGRRAWKNPKTGKKLTFDDLIGLLSKLAIVTTRNSTGEIQVSVFGLDAKIE